MKFVIDGVEVPLAARDDDTIDEIKEKFGHPVYLYAKRRVHRTARDIYNLFGRPLTAAELRTVFSNLNISKEVTKAVYTFHDLIELAVGGRHTAWVALGQTMDPSVPVVPGDGADPRHEARLLLDYLPIVGDTVYGTTAAPAYTLPLTRAVRAPLALPSSDLEAEGLHSVHLALPSTSDLPLPLDYLFTVLHASSDVPLIGRGSRYRAHGAVRAPATFNGLTCWFDTSGWLTATFYRDGHVEVLFQCPATEMVPMGALAAVLRPVNRFIHGVNNTLRWGTPLEDRGACSNSEGFPLFESVELADVRDMSYMYVADFVGSRVEPPLREAFARVRCVPSVHATATSTILRVDHVPPAALGCLRAYARACLHELRQADAHSYGFHQPQTVRAQASADLEPREYVWNLPRMVWAPRPLFALRGAQVEAPGLEPGFATVQRYLGPNFYRTPAAPFLQCLATHLSRTVEELKALILARARAMLPLYPNLILHFSTNMTSSVRNHTPFVNFRNYLESEESIDFTFVWELVGDILGANLVLFNGDALYGKIEVIAPCQATLDPSKETVLLFKQEGASRSSTRPCGSSTRPTRSWPKWRGSTRRRRRASPRARWFESCGGQVQAASSGDPPEPNHRVRDVGRGVRALLPRGGRGAGRSVRSVGERGRGGRFPPRGPRPHAAPLPPDPPGAGRRRDRALPLRPLHAPFPRAAALPPKHRPRVQERHVGPVPDPAAVRGAVGATVRHGAAAPAGRLDGRRKGADPGDPGRRPRQIRPFGGNRPRRLGEPRRPRAVRPEGHLPGGGQGTVDGGQRLRALRGGARRIRALPGLHLGGHAGRRRGRVRRAPRRTLGGALQGSTGRCITYCRPFM